MIKCLEERKVPLSDLTMKAIRKGLNVRVPTKVMVTVVFKELPSAATAVRIYQGLKLCHTVTKFIPMPPELVGKKMKVQFEGDNFQPVSSLRDCKNSISLAVSLKPRYPPDLGVTDSHADVLMDGDHHTSSGPSKTSTSDEKLSFEIKSLSSYSVPRAGQPVRYIAGVMPIFLVARGLDDDLVPEIEGCDLEEFSFSIKDFDRTGNVVDASGTSTKTESPTSLFSTSTSTASTSTNPHSTSVSSSTTSSANTKPKLTTPLTKSNFTSSNTTASQTPTTEPSETGDPSVLDDLLSPYRKHFSGRHFKIYPQKSGWWEFMRPSSFVPDATFAHFIPQNELEDCHVAKVIIETDLEDGEDIESLPLRVKKILCKKNPGQDAGEVDFEVTVDKVSIVISNFSRRLLFILSNVFLDDSRKL